MSMSSPPVPSPYSRLVALFTVLLAIINLIYVGARSCARYLLFGPLVASWDIRSNVRYDLFWYMIRSNSTGLFYRASTKHWIPMISSSAKLIYGERYPCTALCVQMPAVPISVGVAQCTGRWENQLLRMSAEAVASGESVSAERIAHASVNVSVGSGKVILYFHGGAYVMGSVKEHRYMHSHLTAASKLPIYSVEYRLAPQSKYPTQLYDAYCAYTYLRQSLGYSSCDIVFGGDSAGGNLALALWQLVHAQGECIGALVLLSPRVDISYTRDTWRTNADIDFLHPELLGDPESSNFKLLAPRDMTSVNAKAYALQVEALTRDPFLAPVNAELSGLPPTLIQAGDHEAMYADICEFAARAIASTQQKQQQQQQQRHGTEMAGARVELQVLPGGLHVPHMVMPELRGVDKFWTNIGVFIQSLD